MTHNAAHLFSPGDGAVVFTAADKPRLAAHDAAHIIAHVLIAHSPPVFTVPDHAAAGTGNAADIRDGSRALGAGKGIDGDIRDLHRVLLGGGIDLRAIDAAPEHPHILTRNAADKVIAVHTALRGAVFQDTRHRIAAHKTAYTVTSRHSAGKAAVFDFACIAACNAACHGSAALGQDIALQVQILYLRLPGQIPEQARHRAGRSDIQPGYFVAPAVKAAAENGDPLKIQTGHIDIRAQPHLQPHTVAVEDTVPAQLEQRLRGGKGNALFALGSQRRHREQSHQQKAQKCRQDPFSHKSAPPPLPPWIRRR